MKSAGRVVSVLGGFLVGLLLGKGFLKLQRHDSEAVRQPRRKHLKSPAGAVVVE